MNLLKSAWGWFSGTTLGKYAAIAAGAIALFCAAMWKAYKAGAVERANAEAQQTIKDVSEAKDVQAKVDSLPSGRAQKELADKWSRD
jgi:hypothetical protein